MTREEAAIAFAQGKEVQRRCHQDEGDPNWGPVVAFCVFDAPDGLYEFRLKPSPKRIPLTQEDIPAVCWVSKGLCRFKWPIGGLTHDSIKLGHDEGSRWVTFRDLMDEGWEMSTDLKTWTPCWREVEE